MALVPGTLPSDTCYGTPQELLELFAQYLDIPAFAVSSKVLYSDVGPAPNTDFLWVDTSGSLNNVLRVYNFGTYQEYPFAGTAGAPNTLIDGKGTLPVANVGSSDNLLVSQGGVLYKVPFSTLMASIPATSITYPMLSTSATEADNVAKRTAKAWVNFDGTAAGPITPRDDFNVSTVGDNGTGDYTINFSSAIGHANYAVAGTSQPTTNVPSGLGISTTSSPTSLALRVVTWAGTGPSLLDSPRATVVVFG